MPVPCLPRSRNWPTPRSVLRHRGMLSRCPVRPAGRPAALAIKPGAGTARPATRRPPRLAGRASRPPVAGNPVEPARPARRPASPVRTSTSRVRGATRPIRLIRPAAATFPGPAHDDATAARSGAGVRRSVRAPQAPHAARGRRPDGRFCHLHDRGRHRDARRTQGAVHLVGRASAQYCRPRASRDQGEEYTARAAPGRSPPARRCTGHAVPGTRTIPRPVAVAVAGTGLVAVGVPGPVRFSAGRLGFRSRRQFPECHESGGPDAAWTEPHENAEAIPVQACRRVLAPARPPDIPDMPGPGRPAGTGSCSACSCW